MDASIVNINSLAAKVEEAVTVIKRLATDSQQISGVLDVFRNVAEQTNLLALNAVIEEARAGSRVCSSGR